jgi:carbon starvation protein
MVATTWLGFIPTNVVQVIAGMWVAAFAMTTLDTTNRLARYTISELALPLKEKGSSVYDMLTNPWVASLIPAAIGIYLAWSGQFSILWPSFGSANQLVASITLLTSAAWVSKRLDCKSTAVCTIPAYLLWITVTAAIIWFSAVVLPTTIKNNPVTGITVLGIEMAMLIMNLIFMKDYLKYKDQPLEKEQ